MKRHELDAEAALREVARRNHISVDVVRKEIKLAMLAAMCSSDPAIQKNGRIFLAKAIPSRQKTSSGILQNEFRKDTQKNKWKLRMFILKKEGSTLSAFPLCPSPRKDINR